MKRKKRTPQLTASGESYRASPAVSARPVRTRYLHSARMILSDVLNCTIPPLRVESSLLKTRTPPEGRRRRKKGRRRRKRRGKRKKKEKKEETPCWQSLLDLGRQLFAPMLFATATASLSLLLQPLPAGRPLMQPLSAGWLQPAALPAGRSPPLMMQADTGGAAVRIRGFDVWAGSSPLIIGVDWTIMPNERWALLGGNGCGKSTLLRAIGEAATGEVFEGGALQVSSALRFGMLEQTAVSGATSSVRDEVMSRMGPFQAAKAALEAAEAACTSGSVQELEALERAQAGCMYMGWARASHTWGGTAWRRVATAECIEYGCDA